MFMAKRKNTIKESARDQRKALGRAMRKGIQ
jgi:hypothetical protein